VRNTEPVYNGRDNQIEWTLYQNDAPFDTGLATRWQIILADGEIADSTVDPQAFEAGANGVLRLRLGLLATPATPGTYNDGRLIVYTATDPNGIVWQDGLSFRVKD